MNLKILDTGYISTTDTSSQTQLSDANRAGYTGAAVSSITLKSANVTRASDVHIESKPIINTNTPSETTLVSVKNPIYKVNTIKKKEITIASWDDNDIVQIERLSSTKGLKLLYPSVITDTKKHIVEALGAVNTGKLSTVDGFANASPTDDNGTVGTSQPYIVGRVKNLTMADNPDGNYWRINFDFEVSG